jgi:hypothetical protein
MPYALINDYHLIALFQNLIGAISWAIAITILSSHFTSKKFRIIFSILVTSLATTTPIYEHNNVMMSESLSISSLVLFVAFYIQLIHDHRNLDFKRVLISLIWIAGTKQSYALLAPIILIFIVIQFKDLARKTNKYFLFLVAACVCWSFFMTFSTHTVSNFNLVALIYYRFSYVPAWLEWWRTAGFPVDLLAMKDFGLLLDNSSIKNWLPEKNLLTATSFLTRNFSKKEMHSRIFADQIE